MAIELVVPRHPYQSKFTAADLLSESFVHPGGFLHSYLQHYTTCSDHPATYVLGGGLAALAAISNPAMAFQTDMGMKIQPNLFVMILGDSASRKTAALSTAVKTVEAQHPERIGAKAGSYEGVLESLAQKPYQLLPEGEFSRLLSQAHSGGHLEALKLGFTDLFDATSISKALSNKLCNIESCQLSLIGAITPDLLVQNTTLEDYTSGFLSRWFFVLDHRTTYVPLVSETAENLATLQERQGKVQEHLSGMLHARLMGAPLAGVLLDQNGRQAHYQITSTYEKAVGAPGISELLKAVYGRAPALLTRLMILQAMDRTFTGLSAAAAAQQTMVPLQVTAVDVVRAYKCMEIHFDSLTRLLANITTSAHMRKRKNILNNVPYSSIQEGSNKWTTAAGVAATVGISIKETRIILGELVEAGLIVNPSASWFFRIQAQDTPEWARTIHQVRDAQQANLTGGINPTSGVPTSRTPLGGS
jgi:hypothetical protein